MRNERRNIRIYDRLAWLNGLPNDEAEAAFYGCSHSEAWSRTMAGSRPFRMLDDLFTRAETVWKSEEATKSNETMVEGLKRLLER